jgi:hypothetical protein
MRGGFRDDAASGFVRIGSGFCRSRSRRSLVEGKLNIVASLALHLPMPYENVPLVLSLIRMSRLPSETRRVRADGRNS